MPSIENLSQLLETNENARQYFKTLPLDTQLALNRTAGEVSTVEELQKCAENLFHTGGMVM
ncbi:MAG TPA: hypothetical protein VHO94_02365 [Oscillospiraceae bacterium]|nr:hypothetical protein [Oscillospiraceae bacterium]